LVFLIQKTFVGEIFQVKNGALEIHLGRLPLKIMGRGRLAADLIQAGFPYVKEIARSEQLRDR